MTTTRALSVDHAGDLLSVDPSPATGAELQRGQRVVTLQVR
jgi:hypothetical protein